MLIRAAFSQAEEDGVTILEIGEDVWGLGEFFHGNIEELVAAFEAAHQEIAPEIELRLQIGLSRHCGIAYLEDCLSHFWGCKAFYSIDLYGDELAQPIENFKSVYRRAKSERLRLKAHVGEWGTADDVLIFDSDVSKEYLRLYQSGCLDAEELDDIRKNGLKAV